ncbi:MAG TPA: hypothetical protein GX702_14320 [Chloroflexi bacterium]|jgi:hypothetical protein|nr:hypothetical protein [Chloroflexota bacterium]
MEMLSFIAVIVLRLPLILAYMAGLIVSILLMRQRRDSAPILALAGFVLFLGIGIVNSVMPFIIDRVITAGTAAMGVGNLVSVISILSNLASTAAVILLVLAIWFGMRRA